VELNDVKALLTQRREELVERRERIARHTRHRDEPLPPDFAEQAVELENGETLVALDREVNSEIRQIEQALRRIDNGSYGDCTDCGERISAPRLQALPFTGLCIECASDASSPGRPGLR
jgi:RNA polymerase-binding protein DksA